VVIVYIVAVNLTEKIRAAVTGKFSHVSELGINIYKMYMYLIGESMVVPVDD